MSLSVGRVNSAMITSTSRGIWGVGHGHAKLRLAFGYDNYKKYIHTRVVPGGIQIFLFGLEIDQKSVLDCSLFLQHSYFSLRRRRNSLGYWYYVNYDLHTMPSSHKPLYDFALNRHQKSTRRPVRISMQ